MPDSLFKNMVNRVALLYGKNPGKMLVHTGIIGWILSSAAQVCAIMFNDKIPKEQKMFLVPQEIADAGVNITSFYLVTQSFKSISTSLVKSGKLLPKSVKDFLIYKGAGDKLGKLGFDVYDSNLLTPSGIKRFDSFKDGIDVIGTTVGSIISCNLVTPVIRNEIAARRQKKLIAKMNKPYDVASNVKNPSKSYIKRPSIADFYSKTSNNSMTI